MAGLPDFTSLTGPDVRADYVSLLTRLGVPVGGVHGYRDADTGVFEITKVRLNREASVQVIAHAAGHVLDYELQSIQAAAGSLDTQFIRHRAALRELADYTCAHQATSSPDFMRQLKRYPTSKERDHSVQKLEC